jgi:hypothetical protein
MFDTDKDRDYVRLTIFALLNNSWENVKVSDFEGFKDIFVDKGNTYNIDSTDKGLKILIVNNDEKVLNQIFVDFIGKTFIQK